MAPPRGARSKPAILGVAGPTLAYVLARRALPVASAAVALVVWSGLAASPASAATDVDISATERQPAVDVETIVYFFVVDHLDLGMRLDIP